MTRKNYERFAEIIGSALAATSTDAEYAAIYDTVYFPIADYFKQENPNFNYEKFSYAVSVEMGKIHN